MHRLFRRSGIDRVYSVFEFEQQFSAPGVARPALERREMAQTEKSGAVESRYLALMGVEDVQFRWTSALECKDLGFSVVQQSVSG